MGLLLLARASRVSRALDPRAQILARSRQDRQRLRRPESILLLPADKLTLMEESSPNNSAARSINRLTTAVWALAIITAAQLAFSILALLFPSFVTQRWLRTAPHEFGSSENVSLEQYNNFGDWPVEKRIQAASVIAIGRYQKSDSTLKCIISEVLKQKSDAAFYYKVGDEFPHGNQHIRENTTYGDGQILFFTGSPATFRFSCSFTGDRIGGLGDMPLSQLRELIQKSKQ